MKSFFIKWLEKYLFFPGAIEQLISIAFLPLTLLYCIVVTYKRISAKPIEFGIPIVSIGNLVVGGTGKTPVTISLAKRYEKVAVILRGYGRESKGLFVISKNGKILEDVKVSGDEAMMLAKALPNATVIVSEDRKEAILKAKELGSKIVFLDDGFSKHDIKKFDILVRPKDEPTNVFCLPSGGYRDSKMLYAFAPLVLRDGTDFKRIVTFKKDGKEIENLPEDIVLVTAISKPYRLKEFLPFDIPMVTFVDHHNYTQDDIDSILSKYKGCAILTTAKDYVKLKGYKLDLYVMDLDIVLDDTKLEKLTEYIKSYNS